MSEKKLNVSAHEINNRIAAENRDRFRAAGTLALNIIGSPGCGKTSILERTVAQLGDTAAVIIGDVKTALDSDRLIQAGHRLAFPIETGGGCHLSAQMIADTLGKIDLQPLDYLFIENVGNLVCPSSFDLGEQAKVAVLSVPEGDEKVRKYPSLFLRAGVVLINKIDLLPALEYNLEQVNEDCRVHNPDVEIIEISSKTGAGFDRWFDFLNRHSYSSG